MNRKNTRHFPAFTIIEILIVTAVFMVVSIVITQIVLSTTRSSSKSEAIREIKQSGDAAMEAMVRMIQNSSRIDLPTACTTGATYSTITIYNTDGNRTIFECQTSDGLAQIASAAADGAGTRIPALDQILTGGKVKLVHPANPAQTGCAVTPLQFSCDPNGVNPGIITITFGLAQSNTSDAYVDKAFRKYSERVVVRNQAVQ